MLFNKDTIMLGTWQYTFPKLFIQHSVNIMYHSDKTPNDNSEPFVKGGLRRIGH